MAEKQVRTGTLYIRNSNTVVNHEGELVHQDEESITLRVARTRKAPVLITIPMSSVEQSWISAEGTSYVFERGNSNDDYENVVLDQVVGGMFSGIAEDGTAIIARAGTWRFEEVDAAAGKGKDALKKKVAPAAKSKKEEPEAEPDADADEDYTPEVGDYVKVTDADDTETLGEVTAVNAKKITIKDADGDELPFTLSKVTVTQEEAPKPKATRAKGKKEAEPEPEAEADADDDYTPEEGDTVTVTDAEGTETTGKVTAITPKKITIEDDEDDEHTFVLSKVTVVKADDAEEAEAFEPEVGSYVNVTNEGEGDDAVDSTGEVTALTAKKITIDVDGTPETHLLKDVNITEAERPKATKPKGKADKAPAKADKAPAKGAKSTEGWDD